MAGELPANIEPAHQEAAGLTPSRMPQFMRKIGAYTALAAATFVGAMAPGLANNAASALADGKDQSTSFNPNNNECPIPDQLGSNAKEFGNGLFLHAADVSDNDSAAKYNQDLSGDKGPIGGKF